MDVYHKVAVILYILMLIIGIFMIAVTIIAIPIDDSKKRLRKNKRIISEGSESNLKKVLRRKRTIM